MAQLRLVVADDNPHYLNAVVLFLRQDFEIVATASDGWSALGLVRRWKPDVVVLDFYMLGASGLEVTKELVKESEGPPVVICSAETDPETVESALLAGAIGYVFKEWAVEDLALAVQAAHEGLSFVSSKSGGGSAAETFYKRLGWRARELRKRAGYSLADMAAFGFSARDWRQIESGQPIAVAMLLQVCEVFKIKLAELLRPKDGA
jgi:CheY-like chemotaxis protein